MFAARSLSDVDYVYLWVDGIHVNAPVGAGEGVLLLMIGVRTDGKKELIALTDGYRESTRFLGRVAAGCQTPRDPSTAVGGG